MNTPVFTKVYRTPESRAQTVRHHAWLAEHAGPLRQPCIEAVGATSIDFTYVDGCHPGVRDLPMLAALLGDAHGAAWVSDLHRARLNVPHPLPADHTMADFIAPRLTAFDARRRTHHLADDEDLAAAKRLLHAVAIGPVAFYKDTNPRNILITQQRIPIIVDVDDLTLAPFGYDLAKLIVTLAMTYGPLPLTVIQNALAIYNRAAAGHDAWLGGTGMSQLLGHAELHRILTAPYLGRGGYRYLWSQACPVIEPEGHE
ncbi:phosphotransferase [Streptosporangium sp. NBC_01495]|uniref:phosphotransferase n=1 Tax=Streptosporangium sp. NBC_01495 TaxID=2903899 RepID=UPI002E374700|nr:phosphotransferase [Streptosporangium sp. NBC_01495]